MRTNTTDDCPVCGRRLWQTDWKPRGSSDMRYAVQYCERRVDNNAQPAPAWIRPFAKDAHELVDLEGTHFYRVLTQQATAVGWVDYVLYQRILAVVLSVVSVSVLFGLVWALLLAWAKLHGG